MQLLVEYLFIFSMDFLPSSCSSADLLTCCDSHRLTHSYDHSNISSVSVAVPRNHAVSEKSSVVSHINHAYYQRR
ncbi:hypothetical protein B0H10DRAFT_2121860 [Mycena sp. CBHHK59/15]|nr:hypothetical protein B0H10DRAFT_2121860 [Mycena sp. CBHHK59/15]